MKKLLLLFLLSSQSFAGVDVIPERDAQGGILYGARITHPGWQYHHRSFAVETCKLGGYNESEYDGTVTTYGVLKWFDGSGTELVQGGSESDNDFQTRLDSNCKTTHLDWTPTHDYQLIGGQMRQQNAPSSSIWLWVIGVPDIANKVFINNLDLKFMANSEAMVADGRAPKDLLYNNPIPGTNTLRMKFVGSGLGVKHTTQISIELFKE